MDDQVRIVKADEARRQIFGWGVVSVTSDGRDLRDADKEEIPPDVLEAAAYRFVARGWGGSGVDHDEGEPVARLIESMVVTPDKAEALGLADDTPTVAWWVGFQFADTFAGRAAFESSRRGERAWFSIQGYGRTEPIEEGDGDAT